MNRDHQSTHRHGEWRALWSFRLLNRATKSNGLCCLLISPSRLRFYRRLTTAIEIAARLDHAGVRFARLDRELAVVQFPLHCRAGVVRLSLDSALAFDRDRYSLSRRSPCR